MKREIDELRSECEKLTLLLKRHESSCQAKHLFKSSVDQTTSSTTNNIQHHPIPIIDSRNINNFINNNNNNYSDLTTQIAGETTRTTIMTL